MSTSWGSLVVSSCRSERPLFYDWRAKASWRPTHDAPPPAPPRPIPVNRTRPCRPTGRIDAARDRPAPASPGARAGVRRAAAFAPARANFFAGPPKRPPPRQTACGWAGRAAAHPSPGAENPPSSEDAATRPASILVRASLLFLPRCCVAASPTHAISNTRFDSRSSPLECCCSARRRGGPIIGCA